jgi:hypothetical protein
LYPLPLGEHAPPRNAGGGLKNRGLSVFTCQHVDRKVLFGH